MVFLGTCLNLSNRPNDLGTAALFAALRWPRLSEVGKQGQLIGTEADVRRVRRWVGIGIALWLHTVIPMFSVNFGVTSKKPMFLFCYGFAFLVGGVFLFSLGKGQGGTTIRAASVALVDVTTAVASASSGDTVIIPAGTASWTSGLTITKGITLQGSTTVTGDHTTFNATTPAAMTANDLTIIQDNVPRGGFSPVFYFTYTSGTARVTGITVQAGTVSGSGDGGVFLANGSGVAVQTTLRIDHCHL